MAESQPFGRFLLNEQLPTGFKINSPVGKKRLNQMMNTLAKKDPALYTNTITSLKRVGDEVATQEGLSIGLNDIAPDYRKRDAALRPYVDQFKRATTDTQRRKAAEQAFTRMLDSTMHHSGSMTKQVQSGARGSPTQYMKIVGSPVYARDANGKVTPWLIERSYSEGLSPADYYAAGNEAIMDTIKSSTSVSEPGELSKILINNMNDIVITESDCGTTNGILMSAKSPDVIDRYLARSEAGVQGGTLITPQVQARLAKNKKQILVRSPMTCEAGDGVCQKCQGLNENGGAHDIGTNVGIRAAQAMSEPLTQFALNAKHGVRTAASDKIQVQGMEGFRQTIESPKQFLNKATLSSEDGKIGRIEKAPQGGHFVHIGETPHYVGPNLSIKVKSGDSISRGDTLSEGIPKPDEVVKYKGLGAGRRYMVDTLKDLYKNQGRNLDQRHFELLAKGELNHVKILDDPSRNFIPGDVVNYNHFRTALRDNTKTMSLNDARGETLGKEYFHHSVGTRLTPSVEKNLRKEGIKNVVVAPRAPSVEFVMKPATRAPLLNPDWMARLSHRNLKATLQQAAHFGDVTNIHGTSPVPAYAFGVEFGQGEKGRY